LLLSSLQEVERLYVLQGGAGLGKACDLGGMGDRLAEAGFDVWRIHCASDPEALDGLVVPALKLGIVDGTTPHAVAPDIPGATTYRVDLNEACDPDRLAERSGEIEGLGQEISLAYAQAYEGFAEALRIHDEWETVYIANMDFASADELTSDYIRVLFGDRRRDRTSRENHRFLGAATPQGAVDFVPGLTDGLKRYFMKGRPGSGKSTMLKKLAAAATERGLDVEIYHCGFDPNSLDMVIVRELGFAVFDSTAPHEYFPDRPSDEIVDLYERCIVPGTDETYSDTISSVKERYSAKMKESIGWLATTRALQDRVELLYGQCVDSVKLANLAKAFEQEITRLAAIRI